MKCTRESMKSLRFEDVCGARRSSYAGCRSARALLTFANPDRSRQAEEAQDFDFESRTDRTHNQTSLCRAGVGCAQCTEMFEPAKCDPKVPLAESLMPGAAARLNIAVPT